jgi:hypothetical protein
MARKLSPEDYIVDFAKEEEGGGRFKTKEGLYRAKIVGWKITVSAEKKTPGLELTFAFLDGTLRKRKRKMVERLWVSPKAFSRFRTLCEALEIPVPKKLNLKKLGPKLKGKELCLEIQTEKSEDYPDKSVVAFDGFMNIDDYDAEEEDEEGDEDEDEDEDEGDEDDEDEDEDDEGDDEEDEDEDEDEEPAPKRKQKKATSKKPRGKVKGKAASKKGKKKKVEEDEDEDEDIELDDF